MIIDGDGHYLEPTDLWERYIDPAYRNRIRIDRNENGEVLRLFIGDFKLYAFDEYLTLFPWGPGDVFTPGGLKSGQVAHRSYEESEPGGWDAKRRLKIHDENGIDAAVIFPTYGMAAALNPAPELAAASCKAVNRWAAEYASESPGELYIVAALPWQSPNLAADELRRAVEEHGFVAGSMMAYPASDGRFLSDGSLDVLWATATELDVPMCVHSAARPSLDLLGGARSKTFLMRHSIVHPLEGLVAFGNLYEGRVFDRFPKLRFGFMESTCGWAPFWLERLHEHAELLSWMFDPPLTRMPGQIFREQCVVGCEGEEHMVPYVQELYGEETVIWASDFPHFDTEPPFTKDMLERTDMTDSQRDGVMARAAIKFYKLDTDTIQRARKRRAAGVATSDR